MFDLQISGVAQFEKRFFYWRLVQLSFGFVFVMVYVLGEGAPWASLWLDGIILFLPSMAAPRRVAHAGARLLALP